MSISSTCGAYFAPKYTMWRYITHDIVVCSVCSRRSPSNGGTRPSCFTLHLFRPRPCAPALQVTFSVKFFLKLVIRAVLLLQEFPNNAFGRFLSLIIVENYYQANTERVWWVESSRSVDNWHVCVSWQKHVGRHRLLLLATQTEVYWENNYPLHVSSISFSQFLSVWLSRLEITILRPSSIYCWYNLTKFEQLIFLRYLVPPRCARVRVLQFQQFCLYRSMSMLYSMKNYRCFS